MKLGLKRTKVSATCPLQMRATPPPIPITSCVDEGVKYIEHKAEEYNEVGFINLRFEEASRSKEHTRSNAMASWNSTGDRASTTTRSRYRDRSTTTRS
jgi:hypothetical protein